MSPLGGLKVRKQVVGWLPVHHHRHLRPARWRCSSALLCFWNPPAIGRQHRFLATPFTVRHLPAMWDTAEKGVERPSPGSRLCDSPYSQMCLLSSGTPQSPGTMQRQQFRVVCYLRNPRNRRSTRLCLWESLCPRAVAVVLVGIFVLAPLARVHLDALVDA